MPQSSNNNIFQVVWEKLVYLLLPPRLRGSKLLAWVNALIAPITLHARFLIFKREVLYYLFHNSQVVYLEAALNDRFDNTLRRIRVVDNDDKEELWLYRRVELKFQYLFRRSENKPRYLYRRSETALNGPDFIVEVPVGLLFNVYEMKALINRFRLPSKNYYKIIYV